MQRKEQRCIKECNDTPNSRDLWWGTATLPPNEGTRALSVVLRWRSAFRDIGALQRYLEVGGMERHSTHYMHIRMYGQESASVTCYESSSRRSCQAFSVNSLWALAFSRFAAACLTLLIGNVWENRKRERGERDWRLEGEDADNLGDDHPHFRFPY